MANYEYVLYEKQRKGVLITLNRPEALNAISPQMEGELHWRWMRRRRTRRCALSS